MTAGHQANGERSPANTSKHLSTESDARTRTESDSIRVVSFNIRKGKGPLHRKVDPIDLNKVLELSQADLLCCQEVFHDWTSIVIDDADVMPTEPSSGGKRPVKPTNLKQLSQLDRHMIYAKNAVYRRGHHGNAIVSRFHVHESLNRDLSTNPIERRGVLYSRIAIDHGHLHLFNTHLGLNRGQRIKQVSAIARLIDSTCRDAAPVILAGDFNDWFGQLNKRIELDCGLKNVNVHYPKPLATWPSFRPKFSLDRIYYRGLTPRRMSVLSSEPWPTLSDHLPIIAEFDHPHKP